MQKIVITILSVEIDYWFTLTDAVLLFLAHRTKDGWANLVDSNDVFVITVGETTDAIPNLDALQSRIKQGNILFFSNFHIFSFLFKYENNNNVKCFA